MGFADGSVIHGTSTRRRGAYMNQGQVNFLPLRYPGKLGVLTDCHGWAGDLCLSAFICVPFLGGWGDFSHFTFQIHLNASHRVRRGELRDHPWPGYTESADRVGGRDFSRFPYAKVTSSHMKTFWMALRSLTPSPIGFWNALRPEIRPMPPARLLMTAVATAC